MRIQCKVMYCHYVTININTNHTSNNEEHKTCVILVLVKKDDDTKTITDCTNCVVNRKIVKLTCKKTILFVNRGAIWFHKAQSRSFSMQTSHFNLDQLWKVCMTPPGSLTGKPTVHKETQCLKRRPP